MGMNLNILRWRSLQTRITFLTLLIFLLGIWSLSFYASRMLREDMHHLVGEQQFSTASLIAADINQELAERLASLKTVAASISTATANYDAALVQTLLEQRPVLQSIFNGGIIALDADGRAIADVPLSAGRLGISYMNIDSVRAALKDGIASVGQPLHDLTLEAPVLSMAVPVRNARGQVTGVLLGVTKLDKANFLDKMTQHPYGQTGGYLLIAPQYKLFITATDKNRIMQPTPAAGINLMHDKYMQGYEGFGLAVNSRGVEELTAAKGIPLAGWFVVISLPAAEAFAPVVAMQHRMLLATALLSVLAGGLTWWMTSWMLRRQLSPMLTAARTLALLSDAKQAVPSLPVVRQDEIGELIQSFNRLLESSAQREAFLQQVLDTSSVAIFIVNMQGRITLANQRMAEMFGCPLASLLGAEYISLVHPDEHPESKKNMLDLFDSKIPSVDLDRRYWRADQSEFWGRLTGKRSYSSKGEELGLVGVIADITERKQRQQYEQFRSRALELLAEGAPLAQILEIIVHGVEQLNPAMLVSIMLLDSEGKHLVTGAAPSLPDFYNAALEGIAIGMGVGSCGTTAFTGQRMIVNDIATHPYWAAYKDLAASARLGACWSQPILSSSAQVLGTFAIYHREAQNTDLSTPADMTIIEQFARLASITIEHKHSEEKLKLAAKVFTYAREGILITSADGTIIDVNEAFSRITGYRHDEVVGKNPRLLNSHRQGNEFYVNMWQQLQEKGHYYGEIWNRRKNGEVYAEMQTITAVRDAQGDIQQYVALFSDITAIKEHQNQLERIAHYDALTSLPNRVLLADRLRQGMNQTQRRGQALAVAFLDLDGFKAINDQHGHEAGDQLLIGVATNMKNTLRDGDTLARIGGDEFVAVLVDLIDVTASAPMLVRLLAAAAQPVHFGELILQVSASLGVTFYPQTDNVDADQLLRQADQAMYQAKLAGKNRYHVFDAVQDRSVRGHHESLESIRKALIADEFVLYYQPKVNMRTGAVVGAEALIRWQHPTQGLLQPAVFLPAIEDDPLAIDLGEWVIHTALTQIELWQTAGAHIPVSANVGARQLQQKNFSSRLREILAAHPQVAPSCLQLEVLETSALEDVAGVSQLIEACREIGVTFALDDFGTGYSSLTYLKRLPVTQLKIDQSFVRDMLDDPEDLAILEGVIGLASAFRREVIAEGVESAEHGTMLLQLGCELAQGYGIARPMPAHELPDWCASWRPDPAWNHVRSIRREDLPLLFACVEHRAWIKAMENYLNGDSSMPPPLDHLQCHFGQWLHGEGRIRHGAQTSFASVESLHQQIHVIASELCAIHGQGQEHEKTEKLHELHDVRDALLEQLKLLAR
ncbi:hypothetical protein BH11PSE12_BH11PSE12_23920 [soil metagenome]